MARMQLPSSANRSDPPRVREEDRRRLEPDGDREHAEPDHQAADHRAGDIGDVEIERRQRGQQHEDDVAVDLRLDQRRRAVGERVLQHRHHHQAGDQERRIADAPVEHRDVRLQHMREDQQVQQRRQHRRRDRLEAHLPEAQQLLVEQRAPAAAQRRHGAAPERDPARPPRTGPRMRPASRSPAPPARPGAAADTAADQPQEDLLEVGFLQRELVDGDALDPQRREAGPRARRSGRDRGSALRPSRRSTRGSQAPGNARRAEPHGEAREAREQVLGGVERDDPAGLHHRDAPAQRLGLLQVMRGQDDRVTVGVELADEGPQVLPQLDVDARGRLVEHDHRRPVHQRLRDQHATLHAAGQRAHVGVGLRGEVEVVQDLVDPVVVLRAGRSSRTGSPASRAR